MEILRIDVPNAFRPIINVVYPPSNHIEYERWFDINFFGCESDRWYLPIYFCAYQVNNNYGKDAVAMARLQDYVDILPMDRKYFCISQFDDGVGVDWRGRDVLEFNMSKVGENKYPLPLIGQPHPHVFNEEKKYLANFVGVMTHPIREHAKTLMGKEGYYISFDRHEPKEYCRIIAQSHFTLCYRGYGINSFRVSESLQYGSIPIYISDDFLEPHNINFGNYGFKFTEDLFERCSNVLDSILEYCHFDANHLERIYREYYTYEGTRDKILNHLKNNVD